MLSAFDQLENQAYRQAGIMPGTKRGQIDDGQRKAIDNYIYNGVRRNPSMYANDPRASKYLKNTTYEDRQALAQKEIAQGVNPGGIWDDFSTGGFGGMNEGQPDEDEQEDRNQSQDDNRGLEEEPDEETESGEEESPEDKGGESDPEQNEESEPGAEPEPTSEPALGTDAAGKGASATEEGASSLAKGLSGAGEAAEEVGAATEVAGTAAVEGGAAVAATSGIWLLVVAILVAFFLVLGLFTAIAWNNPDSAKATTDNTPTVICIDPGHPSDNPTGGTNTGTSSPSGVSEKSMNWLVAKDLEAALDAKGYKVVLTKDTESQYVTNKDRVDKCAAAGAALDYRIHMDSPGSVGTPGPWHEIPGPSFSNIHDTSKKYADAIQDSVAKELSITSHKSGAQPINGGVRNDTKALIGSKEANIKKLPVALIEMMTMDNVNVAWLKNDTNRAKLVKGIANGIAGVIPVTTGGGGTGDASTVIALAKTQLGKAYVYGACHPWTKASSAPPSGCNNYDCSGLVGWAWYWGTDKKVLLDGTTSVMNNNINNTSKYTIETKASALPGDMVLYPDHVTLYLGNNQMIAAPHTGDVVKIEAVYGSPRYVRPVIK